ncbi:MAG: ISL3 family transposase [Anaerolineae bacterium]
MLDELLVSHLPDLRLDGIQATDVRICLSLTTTSPSANCPCCDQSSHHIHSRYQRCVADLPFGSYPVQLVLHVRRFFCANPACSRRIFCERLVGQVRPKARCTDRLVRVQERVALEAGGECGARVLAALALSTSGATLLRRIRRMVLTVTTPRVLGVDDYAIRKGHTYATILVDLEKHRPVDLLPDRSSAALEHWLKEHPGIEFISRDRATDYADGASRGAPHAVQVADRFHLLQNVVALLQRLLERHQKALREAASVPADEPCF